MKKYFLLLLVPIFFACHKESRSITADYLVISHQSGFVPYCETYKITLEAVFADSASCAFNFNTPALAEDKYQIAKSLLEHIPQKLLDENRTIFQCENCADAGGYYIEFQYDEKVFHFSADDISTEVPTYLKKFIGEIQTTLNDLR